MFVSTKMLTISAVVALIAATVAITSTLPSPSLLSQQAFGQSNATQEAASSANQTGVNMTTAASGGGGNQEPANKQLDQAMTALDSGDNAAAEEYLKEADNSLSGEAKMHVGEAMKALQAGDMEGAKMHTQVAQGLL
jgi:cellobiose-specific phosphotransferase system component IIA